MTDWENQYRQGETPWDKGEPAPALVDFLQTEPMHGAILVPGCGLGHDVRAIAAASPESRVIGLDLAPTAVQKARSYPTAGREEFVSGDLFELESERRGAFDWVWEHTCYCAISPEMRAAYIDAVHTALRPGGKLVGVFYLNPYDEEHHPDDGRPPFGTSLEDLEEQLGSRFVIVSSWIPERAYPGREGRERMIVAQKP